MATAISSTQGFFNSDGSLRVNSNNQSSTPESEDSETDSSVAKEATTITDAVVSKISSQLNVRGSGFDTQVSGNVVAAVYSALERRSAQFSATSSEPSIRREIGGTYQNTILRGATSPTQTPTAPTKTTPTTQIPEDSPAEVSTPGFPSTPTTIPQESKKARGRKRYQEELNQENERQEKSFRGRRDIDNNQERNSWQQDFRRSKETRRR